MHPLFIITKPLLSQARALIYPKVFVCSGIPYFTMPKIDLHPYTPNQLMFFPQKIDEDIAENDPVRIVNAIIDNLDLEAFKKLYKEKGRNPYHPRIMQKVIPYAYMDNVYSCRRIEELLSHDIHYIWLTRYEKPQTSSLSSVSETG